jgi:hypothetical protein
MANDPPGIPQDPSNPYRSPLAPLSEANLPPLQTGLGSLGQEARLKYLNTAKWIMIVVGILTVAVNGFQFATVEKIVDAELDTELKKQGVARHQVDPVVYKQVRETAIHSLKLVGGALIAIGAVFIVLGLFVKQYPVPLTITGLVLYIGSAAVFVALDPTTLMKGAIIKIFIVIGLVKAVQAALAYERERKAMTTLEYGG